MEFDRSHRFQNFGRNVSFDPRYYFEPRSEQEVLDLLQEHKEPSQERKQRRFRAIGALHSWSKAPVGDDVVLCLRHLTDVRLVTTGDQTFAEIGAGCSIHSVLEQLHEHGLTLPAIGMTGEQSIAGAISTATHGSGRSSISHYVTAVRVASYNQNGVPTIRELTEGPALRAARCALGRMGIVLSVRVQCVPSYLVEETSKMLDTIDDVLSEARDYPLTQFYLMPWSWKWMVELRRQVEGPKSKPWARLRYRMRRSLSMFLLNFFSSLVARCAKLKPYTARVYRTLTRKYSSSFVIDHADRVLMMKHRQRYVEAELFVPVSELRAAAKLVEEVLRYVGGDAQPLSANVRDLIGTGGIDELNRLRGTHVHHYPITFRRVHQDSTLISMSSDAEMFAISLVTLDKNLDSFETIVSLLASTMTRAFQARPHWGKVLTLGANELNGLIPGLREFRTECDHMDPDGAFASDFTERVLGF